MTRYSHHEALRQFSNLDVLHGKAKPTTLWQDIVTCYRLRGKPLVEEGGGVLHIESWQKYSEARGRITRHPVFYWLLTHFDLI